MATTTTTQKVLIAGAWREADASGAFHADNPQKKERMPEDYPVSTWKDCDAALDAAVQAAAEMRKAGPDQTAAFLEAFADRIDANKESIAQMANAETALPVSPRLADVELPRTSGQLRQAAAAARARSWSLPTIDTAAGIRSYYAPLGPVCVFGPNNFPLAFNSVSGGDFAAALAAGNPVIAKANSSHPGTSRLLAEQALDAIQATGFPQAAVQMLYRTSHADGERLVADPRVGATGYTGSRSAGLKLKAAADAAGKPIYLELSSINPVVVLPGALEERLDELADEFTTSCLMGTGQFCTNPGLLVLLSGGKTDAFIAAVAERFEAKPDGTLLSEGVSRLLTESIKQLNDAGAEIVTGERTASGEGYTHANTLLKVSGQEFLGNPEVFQTEAFGNESLVVVAKDAGEAEAVLGNLEGNLTGCFYSGTGGSDDALYEQLEPAVRRRVGRLLNDKMPTGVAVSPAMNHGGPYPATGHPGFTAVGIPASLLRFGMLQCYDNIRPHRLPPELQDKNPTGNTWRLIDGVWTQGDVS